MWKHYKNGKEVERRGKKNPRSQFFRCPYCDWCGENYKEIRLKIHRKFVTEPVKQEGGVLINPLSKEDLPIWKDLSAEEKKALENVKDGDFNPNHTKYWRRRKCPNCEKFFYTEERLIEGFIWIKVKEKGKVVKKTEKQSLGRENIIYI